MNRYITQVLACLLFSTSTLSLAEFSYTIISNERIMITGYEGNEESVSIPSTIEGLPVTSITGRAFEESLFSEVSIPASIEIIGIHAFDFNPNISKTSVHPSSKYFTSVDGVLYNKNITKIVSYPAGKAGPFTIPNTIQILENWTFGSCPYLTSITIPDSVTQLGEYTFRNCTDLTKAIIGNGITNIGKGAFDNCPKLKDLTLSNSIKRINGFAFGGCSSLTDLTIPDSVEYIGDIAFINCINLKNISFGSGLKTIENNAFEGCSSLESVDIPASVTDIGLYAFKDAGSLQEILIDPNNANYTSINGILYNKALTTLIRYPEGKSDDVAFPDTVTSIEIGAFSRNPYLTNIVLPNTITEIDDSAFAYCSNLTSIRIPESVTRIGYLAFEQCTSLSEITLPDSLVSLGDDTFSNCTNLVQATLGTGLERLGSYTFMDCDALESIIFTGDAPNLTNATFSLIPEDTIIYYRSGTTGWSASYGGRQTVLWNSADSFNEWISYYPSLSEKTGFNDDPDGDGHVNGMENFFATNPSTPNAGLITIAVTGGTATFSHPESPLPLDYISISYEWSTDAKNFYSDNHSNESETTTVTFSTEANSPVRGNTRLTATVSGQEIPKKLFVRIKAQES